MGDPDLRNDESVLVRTPGVYVKSIPFEGLLTNKRIILVDRAKNLLPAREIPLVTIRDIDAGENAIRDQILTLTISGKAGETRKMILTFSRQAGGNRVKERDEWYRLIRQYTSSVVEQPVRNVVPYYEQPEEIPRPAPIRTRPPESSGSPGAYSPPTPARAPPRRVVSDAPPVRKIVGTQPPVPITMKESQPAVPSSGSFCTRCGNRLAEGSAFCNRCGSQVVVPGQQIRQPVSPVPPASPQPIVVPQVSLPRKPVPVEAPGAQQPVPITTDAINDAFLEPEDDTGYPYEETSIPDVSPARAEYPRYQEPPAPAPVSPAPRPAPAVPQKKPEKKRFIPRLFSSKESASTPAGSGKGAGGQPPAPKKLRQGSGFKAGKKIIIGIVALVFVALIAFVGVTILYPMLTSMEGSTPGSDTGSSTGPTVTTTSSSGSSGATPTQTFVVQTVTPAPTVPSEGVYMHVNYIAGWKASYGMPNALVTKTNSGDRFLEIENATGTVQATVKKLDSSTNHELLVELYKNGNLLAKGNTSAANGEVTITAKA